VKFGSKFSLQLITIRNINIQKADRNENLILNTDLRVTQLRSELSVFRLMLEVLFREENLNIKSPEANF
jgi:hypothetical protein